MSVYGDFLEHFNELVRYTTFWSMDPTVDGELIPVGETYKWPCIVLEDAGDSMVPVRVGKKGQLLEAANHDYLFTLAKYPVVIGMYVRHPEDGTVCKIVTNWGYGHPAGYNAWSIQKVAGANGENDKKRLVISEGSF
jgi:hypothetical protein